MGKESWVMCLKDGLDLQSKVLGRGEKDVSAMMGIYARIFVEKRAFEMSKQIHEQTKCYPEFEREVLVLLREKLSGIDAPLADLSKNEKLIGSIEKALENLN